MSVFFTNKFSGYFLLWLILSLSIACANYKDQKQLKGIACNENTCRISPISRIKKDNFNKIEKNYNSNLSIFKLSKFKFIPLILCIFSLPSSNAMSILHEQKIFGPNQDVDILKKNNNSSLRYYSYESFLYNDEICNFTGKKKLSYIKINFNVNIFEIPLEDFFSNITDFKNSKVCIDGVKNPHCFFYDCNKTILFKEQFPNKAWWNYYNFNINVTTNNNITNTKSFTLSKIDPIKLQLNRLTDIKKKQNRILYTLAAFLFFIFLQRLLIRVI